jgi:hypothetical protein
MTHTLDTIAAAVGFTLFVTAGIARWRKWITRRTLALLWAASCAITCARAAAHGSWLLAVFAAAVVGLTLWMWRTERPTRAVSGEPR